MKLKTLMAAATMCGALAGGSAASASIVDLTFTGTVISGNDGGDQFGGGDLTGDAFTAFYSFDTSMADITTDPGAILGGADRGYPNSLVSSTLKIAGYSYPVMGGIRPTNQASSDPIDGVEAESANNDCSVYCYSLNTNLMSANAPYTVLSPATLYGAGAGEYIYEHSGNFSEDVDLESTKVVITVDGVSAAPEPSAWALMIAGIGLVGSLLRLGRRGTKTEAPLLV